MRPAPFAPLEPVNARTRAPGAPHLAAAFDRGVITLDDDGPMVLAESLDAHAALGLDASLRRPTLTDAHHACLSGHRARVFPGRGDA